MTITLCSAYVLISVKAKELKNAYFELQKLPSIQNVEAVTGPYDIVALVQAQDFNELGNFVIDKIMNIEGVENSITCHVIRIMN